MAQISSPAKQATIQSLAPETLIAIFEQFEENRHPDLMDDERARPSPGYGDLCKFALVCRAWRNPAQLVLFETIHLRSMSGVKNLKALDEGYVGSPERAVHHAPALGWLMSSARRRFRTRHLVMSSWLHPDIRVALLNACPNLESFKPRTEVTSWDERHRGAVESIEWEWWANPNIKGIRELTLEDFFRPPRLALPCQLRTLTISMNSGDFINFGHIMDSSQKSLTTLNITTASSGYDELLDYLETRHFDNVRRLALRLDDFEAHWDIARDISAHFPAVSRFQMDCWHWDDWYTGTFEASTVASIIPSNVQTLVLSISFLNSSTSPFFHTMLEVLKQPELANLRRLEFLSLSKAQFMGASGLDLLEECEERAIVVWGKNEYL